MSPCAGLAVLGGADGPDEGQAGGDAELGRRVDGDGGTRLEVVIVSVNVEPFRADAGPLNCVLRSATPTTTGLDDCDMSPEPLVFRAATLKV
jgi:hypothetical protein